MNLERFMKRLEIINVCIYAWEESTAVNAHIIVLVTNCEKIFLVTKNIIINILTTILFESE